jgi:Protein of unknown function (DUF2637)
MLDRVHVRRAKGERPVSIWQSIVSFAGRVPSGVWVGLMLANIMLTILTWGVTRRRIRSAGERAAHPDRFTDRSRRRDITLTMASLVPAALFWGMVLAGSFRGLVAFGRSVLGWNGGAEYLVPGTLDGVSVTFAFLAFRAIHKKRDPSRSQRVVWAASLSSATVNFAYEYSYTGHNVVAGLYLAALSVFGMVIFHEFLAQFEEGAQYTQHNKRPPWGLRWFTSPYSTCCGAIAWENFPPCEGTAATVRNGLANVERVRVLKRNAALQRVGERHARDLAAARRKAELTAARADPTFAATLGTGDTHSTDTAVRAAGRAAAVQHVAASVTLPVQRASRSTPAVARCDGGPGDPKVPTTAATVAQWARTWMRMCADGDLVSGPLTDDGRARAVYNLSGRQLRNVRSAVRSGALARKAGELGVQLPDGYADTIAEPINGHEFEGIAA